MKTTKDSLQESIARQRDTLIGARHEPLRRIATAGAEVWGDRARLDAVLAAPRPELPHCKYIYALDTHAAQISDNISAQGVIEKAFGRDRSRRPYPQDALVPAAGIRAVLDAFRARRFMDEMLYLRSGTLNVFNGIVALTFSGDRSHYIPYAEFTRMDYAFRVGGMQAAAV